MSEPPPLPSQAAAGDPAREAQELRRFSERCTDALAGCLQRDGTLLDPASGSPVPDDHYAATFTALALVLREPDDGAWRTLLARWADLPPQRRGHAPFNRLALLLLRDTLQHRGALDGELAALVARALAACRTAEAYPSNNWVLLARACALLEAPAGPPRAAAAARVGECLARWITPAGGFIDGPPLAEGGPASTPITYHAKFLLVLLVLRLGAPDSCTEAGPALARGLAWLLAFTDESGRAGGFGRSSHALYGYGCLLALGAHGLRAGDERSRRAWAVGSRRLRLQLESVRRDDGLLSITLNPATGAAGGWDDYMHLLVYNAWTAGLLAWLLALPSELAEEAPLPEPDAAALGRRAEQLAVDERAGLLAARGARGLACLSLAGQPVQGFGDRHADLRYGGALPFHIVIDGQARVAPPCRLRVEALAAQPALGGWTPVVRRGERLYALQRFDAVERCEEGGRVLVLARGEPSAVAAGRSARAGPAWMADQLDHYLLAGRRRRRAGLSPARLEGHHAAVALAFDAEAGWLAHVVALAGRDSEALLLNPHGHALLAGGELLPLRRAVFGEEVGDGVDAAHAALVASVELPCSLAGGRGACAAPRAWPARELVLVTLLGPPGAAPDAAWPLRWDAGLRRLVLPWTEVELLPPRAG